MCYCFWLLFFPRYTFTHSFIHSYNHSTIPPIHVTERNRNIKHKYTNYLLQHSKKIKKIKGKRLNRLLSSNWVFYSFEKILHVYSILVLLFKISIIVEIQQTPRCPWQQQEYGTKPIVFERQNQVLFSICLPQVKQSGMNIKWRDSCACVCCVLLTSPYAARVLKLRDPKLLFRWMRNEEFEE